MALQHLRSSTANKRPTPAGMSDGQLALNTNNTSPGLFFKDSNGALVKVGPVHVGTTAPNASPAGGGTAGNTVGEQWLDTTGGTYVFKAWDGSAWRSASGVFVGAAANATVNVQITNTESSGYSQLNLRNSGGTAKEYQIVVGGSSSLSANNFWLYDATAGAVRVHVGSAGNVGINTTNPEYLLDVAGSVVQFGASTDAFVQYKSSAGSWHVGASGSNAYVFYSGTYGTGSERARIDSSGRLLVGLSSGTPSTTVFGTAIASVLTHSRDTSTGAVAQIYGNAGEFRIIGSGNAQNTNNSYGAISDQSLKTDISDSGSQWDDIKGITVRKFKLIGTDTLQIGVVAQECELVSPGLVEDTVLEQEDGTTSTVKAVKYSVLYMKAVKALQEAMERIEQLEQRLAAAGI